MVSTSATAYRRGSWCATVVAPNTMCVCALSRSTCVREGGGRRGRSHAQGAGSPRAISPHPVRSSASSSCSCTTLPEHATTIRDGWYARPCSSFSSFTPSAVTVSRVPKIECPYGCAPHSFSLWSSNTRSSGVSSTIPISSSTTFRSSSRSSRRSSGRKIRSPMTSTASTRCSSSTRA